MRQIVVQILNAQLEAFMIRYEARQSMRELVIILAIVIMWISFIVWVA